MTQLWQTALFATGLALFLVISAYIFYITSDGYKLRKKRRQLGYETDDWWDAVLLLCVLCLGPINRSRWERKHKYFRTEDYGPFEKDWKTIKAPTAAGQEWQKLPRGDQDHKVQLLAKAVAKCEVNLLKDLFDEALDALLPELLVRNSDKGRRFSDHYLQKSEAERLAAVEAHEQRLAVWEAQAAAELQQSMATVNMPAPSLSALAEKVAQRSEADVRGIDLPLVGGGGGGRLGGYSHLLSLRELRDIVNKMKPDDLRDEFRRLPLNIPPEEPQDLVNIEFSRDPRIPPSRQTRVRLEQMADVKNPSEDFIHANLVRGPNRNPLRFIATQAPLDGSERGTANTQLAFWQMVWQYQACGVVSLVLPTQERCPRYWPNTEEQSAIFGPFKVQCVQADVKSTYTLHILRLSKAGDSHEHIFLHFTFPSWPYQSVPSSSAALIEMVKELETLLTRFPEPLVVHDDRGFGPTGVFLAILHGLHQLQTTGNVDILNIVATLREDRCALVETLAEYQFLHRILATIMSSSKAPGARPPPAYTAAPSYNTPSPSPMPSAPPAPPVQAFAVPLSSAAADDETPRTNSSEDYITFSLSPSLQRAGSPVPPLVNAAAEMRQRSSTALPAMEPASDNNNSSSKLQGSVAAAAAPPRYDGVAPALSGDSAQSLNSSVSSMTSAALHPALHGKAVSKRAPRSRLYDPALLGAAPPLPPGTTAASRTTQEEGFVAQTNL